MTPQLIFLNNTLIIPCSSKEARIFYYIRVALYCLVVLISFYYFLKLGWVGTLLGSILCFPIFGILSYYFFTPVTLRKIVISKNDAILRLNSKQMPLDSLLFLSVREKENYLIIRLEATRKNIMFANEKMLYTGCSNLDESLAICRQIRDFIDPVLKINVVMMPINRAGIHNKDQEIWHYVE
jgi:hypothetical protein